MYSSDIAHSKPILIWLESNKVVTKEKKHPVLRFIVYVCKTIKRNTKHKQTTHNLQKRQTHRHIIDNNK